MSYYGDRVPGDTIDFKFNTVNNNGIPVTPTGTFTVGVYKNNTTGTPSTAGLTFTPAFDSRAGLHHVRITTASDATFYAAGNEYTVIVTAAGTPALADYIAGEFSLSNRAPNVAQAEPGQGAPPASASPMTKLAYLYKAWRNKSTQDATTYKLYADDASTVDQKATTSDDLTTFTRGEVATGP